MNSPNTITVGDRTIGDGQPVYVIAELSGNHNGNLDRAIATIRAAAGAGADAIKLQTYTPETLTISTDKPEFVVPGDGPWSGRTLYDLYKEAMTPWEWHPRLFEEAKRCGLQMFSTPFDVTAVAFLETLGAPLYKIASFELVDDGLLRAVAATGKPVIASTGMANLEEIAHAVATLEAAGASNVILLKCTSSYPAPDESMNLRAIPLLAAATGKIVGLSDHSLGVIAPIVAVTMGARVIEKHFTLLRADGGVDSHFSLEPREFEQMVEGVRRAQSMLGAPKLGPGVMEEGSTVFRRSLYVVENVAAGEVLTTANVRSIRPGYGLSPKYLELVLGHRATQPIERGTPLTWAHVMSALDGDRRTDERLNR
jgi:pseudaminic acid synthase